MAFGCSSYHRGSGQYSSLYASMFCITAAHVLHVSLTREKTEKWNGLHSIKIHKIVVVLDSDYISSVGSNSPSCIGTKSEKISQVRRQEESFSKENPR